MTREMIIAAAYAAGYDAEYNLRKMQCMIKALDPERSK